MGFAPTGREAEQPYAAGMDEQEQADRVAEEGRRLALGRFRRVGEITQCALHLAERIAERTADLVGLGRAITDADIVLDERYGGTGLWCAGGRHARCYPPRRAAGGHADQPGLRREIVAGHDRHGAISQRSRRDRSCSTAMGACPRSAPTATTRSARVSGPGRSRLQPRRLGSRPPCPLCRAAPAGGRSSATRHARGTRRACRRSRSRWRP
jgi:hypothetical protein